MKLIVGLGNHGKKYDHTRHNVGWDAVKEFAKANNASFQEKADFKAEVAEVRTEEGKVILALPLTFMNSSGDAVGAIARYYKIEPSDILIVQDEMDYEVGRFAFMEEGRPAGHNGITSIQEVMGTNKIARLRLGIGRPTTPIAKEDYVLQRFSDDEQKLINQILERSKEAITCWIKEGLEKAMNKWNVKTTA